MNKFCRAFLVGVIATSGLVIAPAKAATIVNGSFEDGTGAAIFAGSAGLAGWTINSGYVNRRVVSATDGAYSIDLAGGSNSSISQSIDTMIGQEYNITFSLSGNKDGGPKTHTMIVSVTGSSDQAYSFVTQPNANGYNWATHTYVFTATSTSSLLTFAAADNPNNAYGPMIDKVSIAAVPEPASWAMLIAGFGMVGASMRRRKPTVRFA